MLVFLKTLSLLGTVSLAAGNLDSSKNLRRELPKKDKKFTTSGGFEEASNLLEQTTTTSTSGGMTSGGMTYDGGYGGETTTTTTSGGMTSGGMTSDGSGGETTTSTTSTSHSSGEKCDTTIPLDGTDSVQLSFYANPLGGHEGDECPSSCIDSENPPVMQQWYAIAGDTWSGCFEWPGHSGENSMINGACDPAIQAFKYDQFTTCDCSGDANSKTVYVEKCIVDKPATLCSKVINFTACETESTSGGMTYDGGYGGETTTTTAIPPGGMTSGGMTSGGMTSDGSGGETTTSTTSTSHSSGEKCDTTIPLDGTDSVQLSFYANPLGGHEGEDCPSSCIDSENPPVMQQWYAIEGNTWSGCFEWPGHSGENSMIHGVCDPAIQAFKYDQFTTCDCSGTANSKTVYVERCIVDKPATLCSKVIDFTACEPNPK